MAVDLPLSAYLAESYVPPGRQKIEMYRKLFDRRRRRKKFTEVEHEGSAPVRPDPRRGGARLISLRELQFAAWDWGVDEIHLEERSPCSLSEPTENRGLAKKRGERLRVVDNRNAYFLLEDASADQ